MKNFRLIDQSTENPGTLNAKPMILPIVFCMICGVLLIVLGNLALRITAYALAGVMVGCGIWSVVVYIRSDAMERITGSMLATGLVLLVSGILLAFNPDYLKEFLPFIWGLALLFGGFLKIQYAFDEKTVKVDKWWIMLVLAGFSIIIGVISLLNPEFLGESRNLVIGIMLAAEAVLDIVVFFLLKNALQKYQGTIAATPTAAHETASTAVNEANGAGE